MVKIPNLDDLKKMGSGIIDSAKNVNISGMVDKLKSGMDSVSGKGVNIPQGDEAVKTLFLGLQASLSEIMEMQASQATAIKKMQSQLSDLARVIEANQKQNVKEETKK